MQTDRRVADERELSDSEDEDGDNRRNQSNSRSMLNKRKASPEPVNGLSAAPATKAPETVVDVPVVSEATAENGPATEPAALEAEKNATVETEEETKTTTEPTESETPAEPADESAPKVDGMDTSE